MPDPKTPPASPPPSPPSAGGGDAARERFAITDLDSVRIDGLSVDEYVARQGKRPPAAAKSD